MFISIILLVSVCAFLFYYHAIRPFSYWKKLGVIQGFPYWLFGDSLGLVLNTQSFPGFVLEVYNRFKNVRYSGIYQLTLPTLVIHDLELIKQIAVKDFDHFSDRRVVISENADPFWGRTLLSLKGENWKKMRQNITPVFTSKNLKHIFELVSDLANNFVDHFFKEHQNEIIEVEVKDAFTRLTNDVIALTMFGIKTNSLSQPNNEFYRLSRDISNFDNIWKKLKFFGFMTLPQLYNFFKISLFGKASYYFQNIIETIIKTRENYNIVRPDLIEVLPKARYKIQNSGLGHAKIENLDIAAQAILFVIAGIDTVTSVMNFMAYELVLNPTIQNRLRQEIKKANETIEGDRITIEELTNLKYLDMVVNESLRKWPNAATMSRVCTKPYTIHPTRENEKSLHLEKGTVIWIPLLAIHRDPNYFPEPEKFDPERFNDENKSTIQPYTFIPFGVGPRICLGSRFAVLIMKTIFYYLLLNFELVKTEKTPLPPVVLCKSFTPSIKGGFHFGFKRITKDND